MPIVSFASLPDESRVWIFGSARPLAGPTAERLLSEVDRYLASWNAHGAPLTCARDWRDEHFLIIGVDTTTEMASGCSVDGLFRTLQQVEQSLEARLLGGGRIFYRDMDGRVQMTSRAELGALVERGDVSAETPVFDTSLTTAGDVRRRFEVPARATWVAALMPAAKRS
jgi:hypothetical protein